MVKYKEMYRTEVHREGWVKQLAKSYISKNEWKNMPNWLKNEIIKLRGKIDTYREDKLCETKACNNVKYNNLNVCRSCYQKKLDEEIRRYLNETSRDIG